MVQQVKVFTAKSDFLRLVQGAHEKVGGETECAKLVIYPPYVLSGIHLISYACTPLLLYILIILNFKKSSLNLGSSRFSCLIGIP